LEKRPIWKSTRFWPLSTISLHFAILPYLLNWALVRTGRRKEALRSHHLGARPVHGKINVPLPFTLHSHIKSKNQIARSTLCWSTSGRVRTPQPNVDSLVTRKVEHVMPKHIRHPQVHLLWRWRSVNMLACPCRRNHVSHILEHLVSSFLP
jgi:hypothetical protein